MRDLAWQRSWCTIPGQSVGDGAALVVSYCCALPRVYGNELRSGWVGERKRAEQLIGARAEGPVEAETNDSTSSRAL